MPRYLLEVAYKGSAFSGFQIQKNANTVQAEVEKALQIYYKNQFELTGSSRTDAGVHALQNFLHTDIPANVIINDKDSYHLNAILPDDIVIKNFSKVADNFHCRFDALSREYHYHIYSEKDPFKKDIAWFYPYQVNEELLLEAANCIKEYKDFSTFSKKNTQVHNFICNIYESKWEKENGQLIYKVKANRFLRGMVKGLVGTMIKVGRGILSIEDFRRIIEEKNSSKANFSVPGHGLFLVHVNFK
jgi:tRNA pseudouridine38-40 synthase